MFIVFSKLLIDVIMLSLGYRLRSLSVSQSRPHGCDIWALDPCGRWISTINFHPFTHSIQSTHSIIVLIVLPKCLQKSLIVFTELFRWLGHVKLKTAAVTGCGISSFYRTTTAAPTACLTHGIVQYFYGSYSNKRI